MLALSCLAVFAAGQSNPLTVLGRIAFAPNGHTIAVSDLHGLTLVDAASANKPIRFAGRAVRGEEASMVFSGDSAKVAESSGEDVLVWDIRSAKLIGKVHAASDVQMSLSHDGSQLAWCPRWDSSSGREGTLIVNDVRSGNLVQTQRNGAEDVKYSPDGKCLAIACRDGSVRLLDPLNLAVRDRLICDASLLLSVDFSPSGRKVVAGGAQRVSEESGSSVLNVWDLSTKKIVYTAPSEPLRLAIMTQFIGESAVNRVSMILFFMGDGMNPEMKEERFATVASEKKPALSEVRYSGDGKYAAKLTKKGDSLVIQDLTTNKSRTIRLR